MFDNFHQTIFDQQLWQQFHDTLVDVAMEAPDYDFQVNEIEPASRAVALIRAMYYITFWKVKIELINGGLIPGEPSQDGVIRLPAEPPKPPFHDDIVAKAQEYLNKPAMFAGVAAKIRQSLLIAKSIY